MNKEVKSATHITPIYEVQFPTSAVIRAIRDEIINDGTDFWFQQYCKDKQWKVK